MMINNPEMNIDGFLVLHEGMHGERGNPHPQYLSSLYAHIIGKGTSTSVSKWIKACTLSIDKSNDGNVYTKLSVINAATASTPVVYDVFFKIRCTSGVGTVDIRVTNTDTVNIVGVVSQDDSSKYSVDLYLKNTLSYGAFDVRELSRGILNSATITYYDGTTDWLSSLPSGTQILSNYFAAYGADDARYVKKNPYTTTNSGSTAGQYALLGTVTITAQFTQCINLITFFGGANGSANNSQRGILYFRAKQQAALGSAPGVEMVLMNHTNCSPSDIVAVITSTTASQSVVQLYIKITNTFDQLWFSPIHDIVGTGSTVWSNQSTLVTTLPTGSQVVATYHQTNLNGATANRPSSGTYSGMPYFDTTLNKPIWRNASNNGWVDSTGTTV